MVILLWLAAFPDRVQEKKKSININRYASTTSQQESCKSKLGGSEQWSTETFAKASNHVGGVVAFDIAASYTHLEVLDPHEREQYHCWNSALEESLEDKLYICKVRKTYLLNVDLLRTNTGRVPLAFPQGLFKIAKKYFSSSVIDFD